MARPGNRSELLQKSRESYGALKGYIDSLPEEARHAAFPPGMLNRNIRDVLAHLHHWHLMFENWYETGMAGGKPEMPAKGFTWKMTPELNRMIQMKYSQIDLEQVIRLLDASHRRVHSLIEQHTNEELFEKKRYAWTGSTSLGAYFVSATSSHYEWALRLIRKSLKK